MLKQQHYTLTNVKKVKSQSTTPLKHFMLPSADKLYGDADFIFQQDLAPAHTAKGTKSSMTMVLLCLIGQQTRLTWTP